MQPYLLPYIGYFQLAQACDVFVIYDDVEYTKKGWINRNRMLLNGEPCLFTIPLRRASDFCLISERQISPDFSPGTILRKMRIAYGRSPGWKENEDFLASVLNSGESNLFDYLRTTLELMMKRLRIDRPLVASSSIPGVAHLRGEDRVLGICRALGCSTYINPIGGWELYQADNFAEVGIDLRFLKSRLTPYHQGTEPFVPALSIVDHLMWMSTDDLQAALRTDFDLLMKE